MLLVLKSLQHPGDNLQYENSGYDIELFLLLILAKTVTAVHCMTEHVVLY